jgi:preprotein translocase subunit SecG
MQLVNLELLREPINWIIVILMLAIAVFGLTLLQPSLGALHTATMQVV